jgi:hypothetical protein
MLAAVVLLGLLTGQAASPAPDQPPQVKWSLSTLATLLTRVPAAPAPVQAAGRRVSTVLARLQTLSAKWPAESPLDYRENLAASIAELERALSAGDPAALAAMLEALADDLEVKLEHCLNSGGRLGGSVAVRVRTVSAGAEVRNWQVFYLPRVFQAVPNATADLFPQLSSPTNATLVPGRYVVWARDPVTTRTSERVVIKVGEGRKELPLDLPVPSPSVP